MRVVLVVVVSLFVTLANAALAQSQSYQPSYGASTQPYGQPNYREHLPPGLQETALPPVAKAPKGPPLGQYLHTLSEDKSKRLVVRYEGDEGTSQRGTFVMTWIRATGAYAEVTCGVNPSYPNKCRRSGVWWWRADGAFCFQITSGEEAPKEQCKTNGNLIGRMRAG